MQGLVYLFVALAAAGIAGTAYFGLTFTPIEAMVTAIAFAAVAILLIERGFRRRNEARLEKAIEDLSRLLSTDAQAGSVLAQRINALNDLKIGTRLDTLEADFRVLGDVMRQVTEAVADLEEQRRLIVPSAKAMPEPDNDTLPEPFIPIEMFRQAVADDRLVFHIEPIVTLPQRKPFAYDLVPRLMMEDGEFADRPDFMPRMGGEDVVALLEARALDDGIVIARRARTAGAPITLFLPLSRATLGAQRAVETMLANLDANRAVGPSLLFTITQAEYRALSPREKVSLGAFAKLGIGLSLAAATTLRLDYAELQGLGMRTVRVDATRFLRAPESFTDFHAEDIAAYARRFGIELMATGVIDEQQLLQIFEDGLTLAQGPHIAGPGPVRPDLLIERAPVTAKVAQ